MTPQPQPPSTPTTGLRAWIHLHLPALLYAWFWFGMFLCGLLAPPDRVVELRSGLVTEGWHLSVMACVLGLPPVALYIRRMSGDGR